MTQGAATKSAADRAVCDVHCCLYVQNGALKFTSASEVHADNSISCQQQLRLLQMIDEVVWPAL